MNKEILDRIKHFKELNTYSVSNGCFACGVNNPEGLHMKFLTDNDKTIASKVFLTDNKKGWDNVVHGGILSTILDEVMAWCALYFSQKIIFTKAITIEYKAKVAVNDTITAVAVIENMTDKSALTRAWIFDKNGLLTTEAVGEYALLSSKLAEKMKMLSKDAIANFEEFLNNIKNNK